MRRPTTQQFRDLGIFNGYDLARFAGDRVYIYYRGVDHSRGGSGYGGFVVCGVGFKTDPNGPWYEYGNKTFELFSTTKTAALLNAQEWCAGQGYVAPYTAWEKGIRNYWHPKGSVKKAVDAANKKLEGGHSMTNVYLEGIMCSCHGTEHNITTDRETLLAALEPAPIVRYACAVCRYQFPMRDMIRVGKVWKCRNHDGCGKRKEGREEYKERIG